MTHDLDGTLEYEHRDSVPYGEMLSQELPDRSSIACSGLFHRCIMHEAGQFLITLPNMSVQLPSKPPSQRR